MAKICAGTLNKAGDTPLSLAYKHRHLQTVEYLAQELQCDPKCVLQIANCKLPIVSIFFLYQQFQ